MPQLSPLFKFLLLLMLRPSVPRRAVASARLMLVAASAVVPTRTALGVFAELLLLLPMLSPWRLSASVKAAPSLLTATARLLLLLFLPLLLSMSYPPLTLSVSLVRLALVVLRDPSAVNALSPMVVLLAVARPSRSMVRLALSSVLVKVVSGPIQGLLIVLPMFATLPTLSMTLTPALSLRLT
jgi:hypothetical protein